MSDKKKIDQELKAAREKIWPELCNKGKPVTRRSLLARGALGMVSFASMNTIINTLYMQRAYGAECVDPGSATANFVAPFLQLELSGGWAPSGAFMFGKQGGGGDFMSLAAGGYARLGLTSDAEPTDGVRNIDRSFGGSPLVANGGFLAGLNDIFVAGNAADDAMRAKIKFVGIAGTSNDDRPQNNKLNATRMALQVSGASAQIAQLVGTQEGNNVTRGRAAAVDAGSATAVSTGFVGSPEDALKLVDVGAVGRALSGPAANKILVAAEKMSASQLRAFNAKSLPQQIKDMVECGYIGSRQLSEVNAGQLDPSTILTGLGIANNDNNKQIGTIVKMLMDGNSAAATIEMGNYDYHGRGLANQFQMDRNAGQTVGIALKMAGNENKPLAVFISTDGSVSCNTQTDANVPGRFAPSNDLGSNSAGIMAVIGGAEAPQAAHFQVGKFSDAGAVDTSYLATSGNAELQALCAIANYAAFIGKMDVFESIMAASGVANPFKDNEVAYLALTNMT